MSNGSVKQGASGHADVVWSSILFTGVAVWWRRHAATVDHAGVLRDTDAEARISASYLFLVVLSACIAIIGLLTNSAAVIIGAMLVSPLMAPIVGLGMGIATLSLRRVWTALQSLLLGLCAATVVSWLIVAWSPLQEATPEILARTRPTLFDLLVAVFSGLAGGYALVRGRGGTVVGVAIATALMPPTTVVGFGLAVSDTAIARGALLLLAANMAAIALAAAAMGAWYGFSRGAMAAALTWELVVGAMLLVPLAQPLLATLDDMAREAALMRRARTTVQEVLGGTQRRLLDVRVSLSRSDEGRMQADVVLTADALPDGLQQTLERRLQSSLGEDVSVHLARIPLADQQRRIRTSSVAQPVLASADGSWPTAPEPAPTALDLPLPLLAREVDVAARRARLVVAPGGATLGSLHETEQQLGQRLPQWSVRVVPPPLPLPALYFDFGSAELDDATRAQLSLVSWALQRWEVRAVRVEGGASLRGSRGGRLAQARAAAVATWLRTAGHDVQEEAVVFPQPAQRQGERALGEQAYQSVRIVIAS